jgi:hypothetical protein
MYRIRALTLLIICSALTIATGASAAEIQLYQSSFDGAGSVGPFVSNGLGKIAIDQATGSVYVTEKSKQVVGKFDLLGNPEPFSALGGSSLPFAGGNLAVNNFGGSAQGSIYMGGNVLGYKPDGTAIGPNFPLLGFEGYGASTFAIQPSGNLFVYSAIWDGIPVRIYTSDGTYSAEGPYLNHPGDYFSVADSIFDQAGYLYWNGQKLDPSNGYAPIEPSPFLGPVGGFGIAINPVTQDVYFAIGTQVVGYHSSNVPSQPFEVLTGFTSVQSIAFDASGDLYVADTGRPTEIGSPLPEVKANVYIFKPGPTSPPTIVGTTVGNVRTTLAEFGAKAKSNGSDTSFQVEYGLDSSYGSVSPVGHIGSDVFARAAKVRVEGLTPGTTYHYRVAATNAEGTTYSADRIMSTFPIPKSAGGGDTCLNVLTRKQTGAQDLLDCRAYELVSARNTGGYDVESTLAPGQTPFGGYPQASNPSSVLYGVHAGAIPGTGNPTNRGVDPYVATRGGTGWSTRYVGIAADINPQSGPFSSTLGGADSRLGTFAFAGAELCKPCFAAGIETGIPVRLPDGRLVQGMAGSLDPGPGAAASGYVAKYLSADGRHLIFGSTAKFEPDANESGVTIYDRNLATSTTHVVSKGPSGATLSGGGVGSLDVSSDGSRILVGQKTATDAEGNDYWHLYMNINDSSSSVDLTPGAANGVLYDGMSADGTKVYLTSVDKLLPEDGDESADVYRADVGAGTASLHLVSAGSSTTCAPVGNSDRSHWNVVGAAADCGAVAVGGGGGVASASGDAYFLSPELLDGADGTLNQPNLYLGVPGEGPKFVATLEPDNPLVRDSVAAAADRKTADFQVTPSGADAVFTSALALSSVDATGESEVFRFHASTQQVDCASCSPTNATNLSGGGGSLASNGLSVTDDGRVFFTTPAALVLKDTNNKRDVYEWAGGVPQPISPGTSAFDSGLLSVSADGIDAYFFTHDTLATDEDGNGVLTKIYDARSGGGFLAIPTPAPCAASDECHGPGTQPGESPQIRTGGPTSQGNEVKKPLVCRKGQVKKGGRCVKKGHVKKRHHKSHARGAHKHA